MKAGERDRPGRFQLASRRLARRLERPTSLFAAWRCRMSLAGGQRQRAGRPRSPERCQPGWRMFFLSMNPHLTLTLSPPIGWERRGNSRRTRIVPPRSVEQRQVHGPNARQNFGVEAFQEPSPHPGPLPSHRMGAEREQETDTNCSTEVCRAAAGSWFQCAPKFWRGGFP